MLDYAQARQLMVDGQLRTFDVNDVAVLDAFAAVARERFVPAGSEAFAYIDRSLPLAPAVRDGARAGDDGGWAGDEEIRVMPAPMLLGRMIQAMRLRPGARVLDVGTGYGYAAALLARLGGRVTALESVPALAQAARERLGEGVEVAEGPLGRGHGAGAPYDAILVEGRVETRPAALLDQLGEDGRLVCVLGPARGAKATIFVRAGGALSSRPLFDAALPPLKAFAAEAGFRF